MTVRKRGKTWQAQVRIKEKGKLVYSESATRGTKAAATLWKLARMEEIKRQGWRHLVTASTTVKVLLEKYAELKRKVKATSRGFDHSLDNLCESELGELAMPELSSAAIVTWAMKRHEAGNAPATVMHHLAILSAAVRAARPLFAIEANPQVVADAIKQLKQLRVAAPSRRVENRITDADLAKILPEFQSDQAVIDMVTFVRTAVALPRRREELCSMLRANLAADGSTLKLIDTKDPRKYREEIVPVPPHALDLLRGLPSVDGPGGRFFPYKPESVSARWQRAVRRAGLPHLRLHDLRHEGICRLFEQGLEIPDVAMISGHTSWATLKRYTHLRPQDVTRKLQTLKG